jgi:hypothetical protein
VVISGSDFGAKRGKVWLVDAEGNWKRCRVRKKDWQAGSVTIRLPKKISGPCDLVIENKAGASRLAEAFEVR